jgi:uncharacterized protein YjbI with pentapeptide repeats/cell wall assembly regulator SMI1
VTAALSATEYIESLCVRLHVLHCKHLRSRFSQPALTPQQRDHLLSSFGLALPESLLATWMHAPLMGAARTAGALPGIDSFEAPLEALRRWRINTAITYELRSGAARLLQDDDTLDPTQAVRHDAWNRGWFPIGVSAQTCRALYVDMAPGPAGRAGQIIEMPAFSSSRKQPVNASDVRVVAPSWLNYLSTAVEAWEAETITAKNEKTTWRFTTDDQDFGVHQLIAREAAPTANQHNDAETADNLVQPAPVAAAGDNPLEIPTIDLAALAAHQSAAWPPLEPPCKRSAEIIRRLPLPEHSSRDRTTSDALGRMERWSRDAFSHPCALLLGVVGSGRTTLLRALARGLLHAAARGENVPVPLVLDLWPHARAPSPCAALDAFVHEATGQHNGGAAVLSAVAQGRCLLLLDNAEALLTEGQDPFAWCRGALPVEQPKNVAHRHGARVLVSCAADAVPDPGQPRDAIAAIAPGWANAADLGLAISREFGSSDDSSRVVRALVTAFCLPVEEYELVGHLSAMYKDSQRGDGWLRWEHRPAWLHCVFSAQLAAELNAVSGHGAGWRALIHSWPAWLARRQAAFAGELSADELAALANSLAQRMWAKEADVPAGGDKPHPELPQAEVHALVQALRPNDAAAQERALWQARFNLGLQPWAENCVRFMGRDLHVAIVMRLVVSSVHQRNQTLFNALLSQHLLTQDMHTALFCAWGTGPNDALARMIEGSLDDGAGGVLGANLRAIEARWAEELKQLSYRPGAATLPALPALVLTPSARPFNAAGMDLTGQDFSDRDLRGACFEGARLDRCSFSRANLAGASLRGALAEEAMFFRVNAEGLQAQGLVAPRSNWIGATLSGAVFTKADLSGAVLRGLAGAEFDARGADLTLASFDESFTQPARVDVGLELSTHAPTQRLRAVWRSHSSEAWMAAAFSPDGSTLAMSDVDSRISIWHCSSGMEARQWIAAQGVTASMAFLPDNRTLVTGHIDGTVQRWDARTGARLGGWKVDREAVTAMALSPCGGWLATGDTQGRVRRWQLPAGTEAGEGRMAEQPVLRLCFVRGINTLWASFHGGNTVEIDVDTGAGHDVPALLGCITPRIVNNGDTTTVLTKQQDGSIRVLRFDGSSQVQELMHVRQAATLELSPDGRQLFVMVTDGAAHVRELDSGLTHAVEHGDSGQPHVEFAPGGQQMLLAWPRSLYLVDVARRRTRPRRYLFASSGRFNRAYWLPDGQHIGIAASDVVLDARTGHRTSAHDTKLQAANNRGEPSGWLHGLDVHTRQVLRFEELASRDQPGDTTYALRVLRSTQFAPRPQYVNVSAFSNDGTHIALLLDRGARIGVWPVPAADAQEPVEGVVVTPPAGTRCLALTDDGALLALGFDTIAFVLLSVATGQVQVSWQAQWGPVAAVAFVAGGRRVLTFGKAGDSVCRLWEVHDGTLVHRWLWPHSPPVALRVGPDGHLAITADVFSVVDAALFDTQAAPPTEVEELPTRFTARTRGDGSVLVVHDDGSYSAYGAGTVSLDLSFEEAPAAGDAPATDTWPRTWAPADVPELARHLDAAAAKSLKMVR